MNSFRKKQRLRKKMRVATPQQSEPEQIELVSNEPSEAEPDPVPFFTCPSCGKEFFYYDFVLAVVECGLIFLENPHKFVFGFTCRFCDEPTTVLKEFSKTQLIPQAVYDICACICNNQPWVYSLMVPDQNKDADNPSIHEFHRTGRWVYNSFPYTFEGVHDEPFFSHMREIEPKENVVSDLMDPGEYYFNEIYAIEFQPDLDPTKNPEGPSSEEDLSKFKETINKSIGCYQRGSQIVGPGFKALWFSENAVNDVIRLNIETLKQKKVFPRYYLFDPTLATINHFSWKHKLQIDFMNEISSRTDISISGMFSGSSKDSISKAFEFLTILDQPYPSFFHEYFSGQKGVYHTKHSKSIEPLCVLEEKCIYHPKGSHRLITKKIWDHFHKDYIQEALVFNADRFIDEFCEAASNIAFTYKTAWDLKEKHLLDLYASIESRNHRAKKKAEIDETIHQQAMEAEKAFPEVKIISKARSINDLKIRISKFGKIVQSTDFKGPVMLLGERGTGKTHFARAIHYSLKLKGAFIQIDCGAIPDKLFESEMFGHKKGAFTGAEKNKTGAFENAVGGTLFLDEIGNLSINHQQKLLGVLQDTDGFWQYQVVGSSETKKSDAFVIVATNSDLETLVKEGKFRADLYDRLNREQILIPPLRERKCDIPLFFKSLSKNIPVSTDLENDLPRLDYDWPDNIRGLIHIIEKIEREKIMNDDTSPICLDDLPESITQQKKKSKPKLVEVTAVHNLPGNMKVTDEQIKSAMENNHGNKTKAAEELGVVTQTIRRRWKKIDI